MQPALPVPEPDDQRAWQTAHDIGEFPQGSPFSRWALARYVVGRVILERVSWSLLVIAVVVLVLAALSQFLLHSTLLAILLVIVALVVLLLRAALRAVLRRLMQARSYGALEDRLRTVVDGASGDVVAELRRVGLPSRLITLPLIAVRLVGRRRQDTLARMRSFEVERAVSRSRLDELHMIIRQAAGAQPPGGGSMPPGTLIR